MPRKCPPVIKTICSVCRAGTREPKHFLRKPREEPINKSHQTLRILEALSVFIYPGPGGDYVRVFFPRTLRKQNHFPFRFSFRKGFAFFKRVFAVCFGLAGSLGLLWTSLSSATSVSRLPRPTGRGPPRFWLQETGKIIRGSSSGPPEIAEQGQISCLKVLKANPSAALGVMRHS